ncbi:MAG: hypothetical protein AMXMBFR47_22890 [Planctomycetota bacterium]
MSTFELKKRLLLALSSLSLCFTGCDCDSKKPMGGATEAVSVGQAAAEDWCHEHGVPESICTRCNAKLIADFKKKGDWCKEHNLPESQCVKCDPMVADKFKAMAPKNL